MEQRQRTNLAYGVIIVVLTVIALALFFAYRELSREGERQAAAMLSLSGERDALKSDAQTQRDRAGALETELKSLQTEVKSLQTELKSLQDKNTELAAEKDRRALTASTAVRTLDQLRGELSEQRQSRDAAKERLQALAAENQALAQKLAEVERQASAAAAARADLSRALSATAQTLEQAKARSARLNKDYESLLKDKSQLAASDAAHRAELERTRKSFEEVQSVIAQLTGARGIYTVQNTDSLSKIAAFFYHDALRWHDIFKANAHLIDHPDLIYPEQVLIVPK